MAPSFSIYLETPKKITKNLSQDIRSPGQDLNSDTPEYEPHGYDVRLQTLVHYMNINYSLTVFHSFVLLFLHTFFGSVTQYT
jgi:hypothetical protein